MKKNKFTNYARVKLTKDKVIYEDLNSINYQINPVFSLYINKWDLGEAQYTLFFTFLIKAEKLYTIYNFKKKNKIEMDAEELVEFFKKMKYEPVLIENKKKNKKAKIDFDELEEDLEEDLDEGDDE